MVGLVPGPPVFGARHGLAWLVDVVRVHLFLLFGGLGICLAETGGVGAAAAAEGTLQFCSEWHIELAGGLLKWFGWAGLRRADVPVGGDWQVRGRLWMSGLDVM